ncbi:hypothetical protein ASD16_11465 [Cellulomonas sp. Root485]|uniref:M15 family metallopeptidase n=1 Tax=Cellulomonas sp. Root485 TaxID=1736546 RepID=UPI0006F44341|nr:M15 family metallopeptidase [Cellulomonas sp. Root485]KQY23181.1 hypothetical protein ASD16_11465 [Cellulomonas sp. Root485]
MAHAKISDQNGRLPDSQLAATSTGHRLRLDAAPALGRVSAAARAAGQDFVGMSDKLPLAGYRTTAEQAELSGTDADAIGAGRSIHSEGLAADLIMSDGYRDARYLWLTAHGGEFGWYQPSWAKEGGSGRDEPWHWEYDPEADLHRNDEEDDMPFSRQELKEIIAETLRDNLGDLAPSDAWGPSTLTRYAHEGVGQVLSSPDALAQFFERIRLTILDVIRSEGITGAGDVNRLASALVPLLQQGAADLSDDELDALRSSIENARTSRGAPVQ